MEQGLVQVQTETEPEQSAYVPRAPHSQAQAAGKGGVADTGPNPRLQLPALMASFANSEQFKISWEERLSEEPPGL